MAIKTIHGVLAVLPEGYLKLGMPTLLKMILVLTMVATFLKNPLHMELYVPLLIEQHQRRPVYRRKRTRFVY